MRLFIAVKLEDEIIAPLRELQQYWLAHGMQGHPTPPENMHLTLAFIGEYGSPDKVLDAMQTVEFAPLTLKLDGVGNFRDTYWAGLGTTEELVACVKRLRRALALGSIPYDKKRFAPHITLMRRAVLNEDIAALLKNPPQGEMTAHNITLFRSERGKNGMIYTPLGEIEATGRERGEFCYGFGDNI